MTGVVWSSTMIGALSLAAVVAGAARQAEPPVAQQAQSTPSHPVRLAEMRHHFGQVLLVHEAVIRGDLPAVRAPATQVANVARPAAMPAKAEPFVQAIRAAGQDAVEAKTIGAAARATVAMVTQCANCHVALGVFPVPSRRTTPEVGALVGHMLEHQLAADDMLVGLMAPSVAQWREGAERLRVAPLRSGDLPKDPKLTRWIRDADVEVHQIAERALQAARIDQRAAAYVELMTNCSTCHSVHSKIWGPGRGGRR